MTPTEYIERNWSNVTGCGFQAQDREGREYSCSVFRNHKWDVWAYRGAKLILRGMASEAPIANLTVIR